MGNSDGFLSILALVLKAASWIGSGALAWYWIEPEGFFGTFWFFILWGILGKVFDFALIFLFASIASK